MSGQLRWIMMVFLALILSVLPLPELLSLVRPPWIVLLFLYGLFFLELQAKFVWILFIGLLLDALQVSVLGEHVFALSMALWVATSKRFRFSQFSVNQQMGFVALIAWLYQAVLAVVPACWGSVFSFWKIGVDGVLVAVLSALCWPWLKAVLDDVFLMRRDHAVQ